MIYEPVKARIDEKDKDENKLQHILTGKAILKKNMQKTFTCINENPCEDNPNTYQIKVFLDESNFFF